MPPPLDGEAEGAGAFIPELDNASPIGHAARHNSVTYTTHDSPDR
jgi:hypothetical protein